MHKIHPAGFRILLPLDRFDFHFPDSSVGIRNETACVKKPPTVTTLKMTARSLEYDRPVGPRSIGVLPYRRLWHNLNLGYRQSALTVSSTDTVTAGVTATDHKHIFFLGRNTLFAADFRSGIHTVLLLKQFESKMYTFEIAAIDFKIAWHFRTHSQTHRIEIFKQLINTYISPDTDAALELDAFFFQQIKTTVNHTLIKLEIGNAETQQSTGSFIFLEHGHIMATTVKLIGTCEAGRT